MPRFFKIPALLLILGLGFSPLANHARAQIPCELWFQAIESEADGAQVLEFFGESLRELLAAIGGLPSSEQWKTLARSENPLLLEPDSSSLQDGMCSGLRQHQAVLEHLEQAHPGMLERGLEIARRVVRQAAASRGEVAKDADEARRQVAKLTLEPSRVLEFERLSAGEGTAFYFPTPEFSKIVAVTKTNQLEILPLGAGRSIKLRLPGSRVDHPIWDMRFTADFRRMMIMTDEGPKVLDVPTRSSSLSTLPSHAIPLPERFYPWHSAIAQREDLMGLQLRHHRSGRIQWMFFDIREPGAPRQVEIRGFDGSIEPLTLDGPTSSLLFLQVGESGTRVMAARRSSTDSRTVELSWVEVANSATLTRLSTEERYAVSEIRNGPTSILKLDWDGHHAQDLFGELSQAKAVSRFEGHRIAMADRDGKKITVYDAAEGRILASFESEVPVGRVLALSPQGDQVAFTVGKETEFHVVDLSASGDWKSSRRIHSGRVNRLRFSPDGKKILSEEESMFGKVQGGRPTSSVAIWPLD